MENMHREPPLLTGNLERWLERNFFFDYGRLNLPNFYAEFTINVLHGAYEAGIRDLAIGGEAARRLVDPRTRTVARASELRQWWNIRGAVEGIGRFDVPIDQHLLHSLWDLYEGPHNINFVANLWTNSEIKPRNVALQMHRFLLDTYCPVYKKDASPYEPAELPEKHIPFFPYDIFILPEWYRNRYRLESAPAFGSSSSFPVGTSTILQYRLLFPDQNYIPSVLVSLSLQQEPVNPESFRYGPGFSSKQITVPVRRNSKNKWFAPNNPASRDAIQSPTQIKSFDYPQGILQALTAHARALRIEKHHPASDSKDLLSGIDPSVILCMRAELEKLLISGEVNTFRSANVAGELTALYLIDPEGFRKVVELLGLSDLNIVSPRMLPPYKAGDSITQQDLLQTLQAFNV